MLAAQSRKVGKISKLHIKKVLERLSEGMVPRTEITLTYHHGISAGISVSVGTADVD